MNLLDQLAGSRTKETLDTTYKNIIGWESKRGLIVTKLGIKNSKLGFVLSLINCELAVGVARLVCNPCWLEWIFLWLHLVVVLCELEEQLVGINSGWHHDFLTTFPCLQILHCSFLSTIFFLWCHRRRRHMWSRTEVSVK